MRNSTVFAVKTGVFFVTDDEIPSFELDELKDIEDVETLKTKLEDFK